MWDMCGTQIAVSERARRATVARMKSMSFAPGVSGLSAWSSPVQTTAGGELIAVFRSNHWKLCAIMVGDTGLNGLSYS